MKPHGCLMLSKIYIYKSVNIYVTYTWLVIHGQKMRMSRINNIILFDCGLKKLLSFKIVHKYLKNKNGNILIPFIMSKYQNKIHMYI